jgi:transketolase
MAGMAWSANLALPADLKPSVWACSKLPCQSDDIDDELFGELESSNWILVVEDHVKCGGLGQQLASDFLERKPQIKNYSHKYVKGYISGLYGSQDFHRKENGLDLETILDFIKQMQ